MQPTFKFPVILVTEAHYEFSRDEVIGSKLKFWFEHEKLGRCLYKQVKEQHLGEDWAEKVASEFCNLLGLPHATYYLAKTWEGNSGVVSPSFLPKGGTLDHGNEILSPVVPNYPVSATYRNNQHTIDIVLRAIEAEHVNLPTDWIGNVDRHHQNWGFVRYKVVPTSAETIHLAPTYDHASSLGRELSDEKRQKCSIKTYTNNCFSAFYGSVEDKKCLKTFDLFHQIALRYPQAAHIWLERLEHISKANTLLILNQIQRERISTIAVEFAQKILEFNQHRLLSLRESIQ